MLKGDNYFVVKNNKIIAGSSGLQLVILELGRQRQEALHFKKPGLYSRFKASLGYIVRPCLQNKTRKIKR
jgi:hypothetical protein